MKPPKGFEDKEVRSRVAAHICRLIDLFKEDEVRIQRMARYKIAQMVIDDEETLTHLEIVKDIDPYQPDLVAQRVENVVAGIAGGYNGQNPFFKFKGDANQDEDDAFDLREAREHDTHLALEADDFSLKVLDIADTSAVWARGYFRTIYVTEKEGADLLPEDEQKDIRFSGPRDEPISAEDFVFWPTWQTDMNKFAMHGHRFHMTRAEMMDLQTEGVFFDDVEITIGSAEDDHSSDGAEFDAPESYHLIVKLRCADHLKDKDGNYPDMPAMDLEEAKKRPMRAYAVDVIYQNQVLVSMEPYDKPTSEYFGPAMRTQTKSFLPAHSVASRGLAQQTLFNDAVTAQVFATIGAIKRPVFIAGLVGEMDTFNVGIGEAIGFRGNPQITVPPASATGDQSLSNIADRMEKNADGSMGSSQVSAGALPDAQQTATATAGALAGGSRREEKYAQPFNAELERSVQFKQLLIRRNWRDFKAFHGEKLKTRKASDWDEKFVIGANGVGPSNNPQLNIQKVMTMSQVSKDWQIPFEEDVDPTLIQRPTMALSKEGMFRDMVSQLDPSIDMENNIVTIQPQAPPQPPSAPGPPGGGPAEGLSPDQTIPPELLGQIAGRIPPEVLAAVNAMPTPGAPNGAAAMPPVGPGIGSPVAFG